MAFGTQAATLGEIEVRSTRGQPLDAAIAIDAPPGERLDAACIFLSQGSPDSGPYVTKAQVGIESRGGLRVLRVVGAEPVQDARAKLRVVVRCPGDSRLAYRQYTALFEPRPAALAPIALPGVAPRVAPAVAALPTISSGFPVLAGDSLASIATALFPGNPGARDAYVEALRAANPSLAAAGSGAPLNAGSTLALPDLRAFAMSRPARKLESGKPSPTPSPDREARAPKLALEAPQSPSARRQVSESPAAPALPVAPKLAVPPARVAEPATAPPPMQSPRSPVAAARGSPFFLKLSSGEVDLSRTRGIDDKSRARLRDRLLVLEVDDQVAAFLALRDSVRKLEGRVADLQLKLSSLPASAPPLKAETPPPAKAEPPPAKVEPPPAKVVAPPKPTPVVAPEPAKAAVPKVDAQAYEPQAEGLPEWLWALVAALVALVAAIGWKAWQRRTRRGVSEDVSTMHAATVMIEASREAPAERPKAEAGPVDVADPAPVVPVAAKRREIGSDAHLATELRTGDRGTLRRRYIEERFPEIVNRAIILDDADSVVKGARLFYEDGAVPRAVELLQFATEEKPQDLAPWLALFEICRLERLSGEYAELTRRFKDPHGKSQSWRKVQYFGRELDPDNPLYHDAPIGIETIKFEAGKPPRGEKFDPISENWLNAPMDFQNEVLANELRHALMAEAKISEADLMPNPLPALRSVEMFTVA